MMLSKTLFNGIFLITVLTIAGCGTKGLNNKHSSAAVVLPGYVIDLNYWNITIPLDRDGNDSPDTIPIPEISSFYHPDFFSVNEDGLVVFTSPNKATTTPNSSNTRSELRQMLRGSNTQIKTKEYANNFALAAHPFASQHASIGSKLEATLSVNHVSLNAGHPDKAPAYSAVVGQIHGVNEGDAAIDGFGYGNEPLKIYFKKYPHHDTGSVFWTYERNLARDNPDRTDIAYAVWGNTWDNPNDPGENGVSLNEEFSYTVNVYENIMYLTFESERLGVVKQQINLSNNVDANGNIDGFDNPHGYAADQLYFKAGIYNQCSTRDVEGFWYTACPGTGVWSTDKANGNYAQSTFSKLQLSNSHEPD